MATAAVPSPQPDDPPPDGDLLSAVDVDLLGELVNGDPADLTDGERTDAVLALAKLSGQMDAVFARYVGDWDGRTVWAGDGARSAVAWLSARTELARQNVTATVNLARTLRACPIVEAAYRNGTLGRAKVTMLAKARDGLEQLFAAQEADLVTEIRSLKVDQARIVINRWRTIALATVDHDHPDGDPEDDEPENDEDQSGTDGEGVEGGDQNDDDGEHDEQEAGEDGTDPEADNSFHLSRSFEDRHLGDLNLDPVSGAELQNALTAVIDLWFAQGRFHKGDGLKMSQRRAMALMELVRRGSRPGFKHGEARPSVAVVIDYGELTGEPIEGSQDLDRRRCQLDDGTPIPRPTAERLMCEGNITTVLAALGLDGRNHVIAVSGTHRHANRRERRALRERDRGCVYPGCDAPVDWTDAHHIDGYHPTKTTTLRRLCLLCRFHHHLCHEGGHRLQRDIHGHITVTRPDGTLVQGAPPGHQPLPHDQGGAAVSPHHRTDRIPPPPPVRPPTRFHRLTLRP